VFMAAQDGFAVFRAMECNTDAFAGV